MRRSGAKPQVARSNLRIVKFIDIIEDEIDMMVINRRLSYNEKVSKGAWGMPRLLEARKDVVSCDKPRGFANEN